MQQDGGRVRAANRGVYPALLSYTGKAPVRSPASPATFRSAAMSVWRVKSTGTMSALYFPASKMTFISIPLKSYQPHSLLRLPEITDWSKAAPQYDCIREVFKIMKFLYLFSLRNESNEMT